MRGVFVSVAVEMPVLARDAAQDAAGQAVPQLQFKTQVQLQLVSIPILLLLIPMLQVL